MSQRVPSPLSEPSIQRIPSGVGLGLLVAVVAVGIGAAIGFAGPLLTVAAVLAVGVAVIVVQRLDFALAATLLVIVLLPYGSVPFKIVFTPTFLDLTIGAAVATYLLQWMTGARRSLTLTPAHLPITLFMGLALFAFVAGLPNGPLTPNLLRQFAELIMSIGLVLVLVDHVTGAERLTGLARVLMWGGALASLIGIVLYVLPVELTNRILSTLSPFGYPAGNVVRYVEDDPANYQRAIATAIDPNALGGMLAMVGALLAPQLVARKPIVGPRWVAALLFALVAACVVLTFSRGALAALAAGLAVIAALRYRRLLVVLVLGGVLMLYLPVAQGYVERIIAGLQGQDLATQMRLGEYKDALTLIGRYPVFGVGFSGTPTADLYLGVSSAYLLMASQMGLTGIAAFGLVIVAVFVWALWHRRAVYADPTLTPIWLGALGALTAALTVGIVDHYFFNLNFQAAGALFWIVIGLSLASTRIAAAAKPSSGAV